MSTHKKTKAPARHHFAAAVVTKQLNPHKPGVYDIHLSLAHVVAETKEDAIKSTREAALLHFHGAEAIVADALQF